jgi:hypothetical protein
VFRARREDGIKLVWDRTNGPFLFAKSLEDGSPVGNLVRHDARRGAIVRATGKARRAACAKDLALCSESGASDALPDNPETLKAMLLDERCDSERCVKIIKAPHPSTCGKLRQRNKLFADEATMPVLVRPRAYEHRSALSPFGTRRTMGWRRSAGRGLCLCSRRQANRQLPIGQASGGFCRSMVSVYRKRLDRGVGQLALC